MGGLEPPRPPPLATLLIGYVYFSGIFEESFVRCDVTRLLGVAVMLLAFETFN